MGVALFWRFARQEHLSCARAQHVLIQEFSVFLISGHQLEQSNSSFCLSLFMLLTRVDFSLFFVK